jgi:serine/threonine protein kinase
MSSRRAKSRGRREQKQCDDKLSSVVKVMTPNSFKIDNAIYDVKEKLGNGTYGATFLAKLQGETKDKVDDVVIKANYPDDYPDDHDYNYDLQEYKNQDYLACMFNVELEKLEHAAKFPTVYFIGEYIPRPALRLFEDEGIQKSIVAGMVKLEHTLQDTLIDMLENNKVVESANLAANAIKSVANTLKAVNRKGLNFVHGDLHVGNIMHDDLQENFHIIDFGASRMNKERQLHISGNPFYNRPNGSLGLDLMTLCLSLVDWINSPYIGEDEDAPHELLDLLWYTLWKFFKKNPTGRRRYHGLTYDEELEISAYFLNPKGFHFLGTGGLLETKHWPKYMKKQKMKFNLIQNYNKIQSGLYNCRIGGYFSVGNKIYYKKSRKTAIKSTVEEAMDDDWVTRKELAELAVIEVDYNSKKSVNITTEKNADIILFKYFGYAAADESNLTGSIFRPNYILSKDAQKNLNFMHDMYNVYTTQVGTVEDVNSVEDFVYSEEDVPAWLRKKEEEYQIMNDIGDVNPSGCVTMMMPQFRTFTFKK